MVDRGFRPVWILFLCLLSVGLPPLVRAQSQGIVNVFVPADRSLRQHLVRASKAIQEERFSDAVGELGILLSSPADGEVSPVGATTQDFFLDGSPQGGTRTSVKTEAERLLATLPPRGRELYELQFGAAAKALLEQAINENNIEKLHEVTRRFFLTKAGGEAALLLGRLYLDDGKPLAAALCLKRLADHPSVGAEFDPELSVLLAACWHQSQQPDKARQVLQSLQQRLPQVQLKIGASDAEPLPSSSQTLDWLARHFGTHRSRESQLDQWILFRGNESRNAESRGGLPLEGFRWRQRLAGSPKDQRVIGEIQQSFAEQGAPAIPALQPLAVGNVVLMRTPDVLLAIDVETGKVVWLYPWHDVPRGTDAESSSQTAANERGQRRETFSQRIWQDSPYGQVSSDGDLVYLLSEFRQVTYLPPIQRVGRRALMQLPEQDAHNELVALELKREGALKWRVGGEAGGEEPQLAGAMFLGPPLPLFGYLYILAEIRGEIRLVVLDSQTGRQSWSQQLAHMEPTYMSDPNLRRFAGASPSFADGVLVCPTTCGAVVGVDIASRRLLWGYQFTQNVALSSQFGGFIQPMPNGIAPSMSRWIDSTATIADGCVILTPPESDHLICLDLLSGQPRWPSLSRHGDLADMLYVACIHEGKIVLVGKNRLLALNLSNGKPSWKQPVVLQTDAGEMPSGRGFMAGGSYFLPTTASQLVTIELKQGRIAERIATDHVLGNLICFKDDVISLSPEGATTYFQIEPLRGRVAKQLEANADDAWALARQGELLVHDGKHADALASLQRAHKLTPDDQGVQSLLVRTFLTALRQDFARHRTMAAEMEPLIENEQQRVEYLLMTADGYRGAGELLEAAESYGKLARVMLAMNVSDADPIPLIQRGGSWSVRLDRFVSARLSELAIATEPTVRDRVERLVGELGQESTGRGAAALERYVQLCGFHPRSAEFRLNLATRLIESGRLLEAEFVLGGLDANSDAKAAGVAEALRAKLYTQTKDTAAVVASYERLRTRWADTEVLEGKTGGQLYREAAAKGWVKPDETPGAWPWGLATIQEANDVSKSQQSYRRAVSVPVVQPKGMNDRMLRLIIDSPNPNFVRDGHGESLVRFNPMQEASFGQQTNVYRAFADGHLMWANLSGQICAISLFGNRANDENAVLWREPLLPVPPESGTNIPRPVPRKLIIPFDPHAREVFHVEDGTNRPIAVTGPMNRTGVCFQKVRTVTCADPLTGKTVWSRNDLEAGLELFGDSRVVIAVPQGSTEAILLDAVDGRSLGKRAVPPAERMWTTCGTRVLTWDVAANGTSFRIHLWDVEHGQDVWSDSIPFGSRCCLVDQDAVAMLSPDGTFKIRSLHDDQTIVDSRIEPGLPVDSIQVFPSRDKYLLVVNDNFPLSNEYEVPRYLANYSLSPVNGRILAFDRADGSPLWPAPAVVRGYHVVLEQPEDVPTLWFVKPYRRGQSGQTQTHQTDVLCLDRRNGALLCDRRGTISQINSIEVIANVAKREVSLILPSLMFTVQFTDLPRPPEPPVQLSVQVPPAKNFMNGWTEKLLIEPIAESILKNVVPATKSPSK